jgi:putative pre-16S rRNA nuclease
MPVVAIRELKGMIEADRRILGFDLGSKTIGLAVSDVTKTIATPREVIRRTKFRRDAEAIWKIVDENEIGALLFGLPISMDGSEGPRCQSTRDFADNLLAMRDIAIAFWDERLSTAAVERVLVREADMTRKRRAEVIDKAAAAYILQGALDALASF